jgi:tetratricopeptide (TPR) repeat protein
VSIDRDAALKRAEKLLRQGRLDEAVREYLRLVEAQPEDWGAINTLGDLYVRAGNAEAAVAQFGRVADHLYKEGFLPRAAALYKKSLKVKSDHEPTLQRLADIAVRQGLLADARMYLRQLIAQRESRGDAAGVAACRIGLGLLEDADAVSRLDAARAAVEVSEKQQAAALFGQVVDELEREGNVDQMLDVLEEAARVLPEETDMRARLARELVASGRHERIRHVLTAETSGDDPDVLVAIGRTALAAGDDAEGLAALSRVVALAPNREADLLDISVELAADGQIDRAYGCIEILVDAALLDGAWDRAIAALETFLQHGPHLPALEKFVEIASDAGAIEIRCAAQARLADAYLDARRGEEARVLAEALVEHDPVSSRHRQRLQRALDLLGIRGVEPPVIADAAGAPVLDIDVDPFFVDAPPDVPAVTAYRVEDESVPVVLDILDIATSDPVAVAGSASQTSDHRADGSPSSDALPENRMGDGRAGTALEDDPEGAAARDIYERGLSHLEAGRIAEAAADLEWAVRSPSVRFAAATRLGRLHIDQQALTTGIEWLERAAAATAPTAEDARATLYDLADALERNGELERALAVWTELDIVDGTHRDVAARIDRLTRGQARSHDT